MPLPPRNEPCPCGSGRKYKKCCGADRSEARAREEQADLLAEVGSCAVGSPQMVPLIDGVEEWADRVVGGEIEPAEALALIPEREALRLVEAFAAHFPHELSEALALYDIEEVVPVILIGAILAGKADCEAARLADEKLLAIEVNEELTDPVEALAYALEGWRLWDDEDGEAFDDEAAQLPEWLDDEAADRRFDEILAATADRRSSEWHVLRLQRMVHEVRSQLPVDGYPRASALIEQGCARFDDDPALGKVIATELLVDVVPLGPPPFVDELLGRLAA
jgi:hypothetical protein